MEGLNKVALITGGTRGIGKGIVMALAKKGFTVYFTGRTEIEGQGRVSLPGSLKSVEDEARNYNPSVFGIKCDHTDDKQTLSVIEKIKDENNSFDLLVNNVWGGYEYFNDGTEFWNESGFWTVPIDRWDKMFNAGVRAHYVTSSYVVPLMIKQKNGLIVNISFWAAQKNNMGVAYGVSKASTNKMVETMAFELKSHNINVVALYPGLVRTESVLKAPPGYFNLEKSESPEFIGMVVNGLFNDNNVYEKSGKIQIAAQLAIEYGIKDIDGKQPLPLTLETC